MSKIWADAQPKTLDMVTCNFIGSSVAQWICRGFDPSMHQYASGVPYHFGLTVIL